jgi:predicted AlkP superfamily pyrophosphatase or phosphodiesterase
VAERACIMVWDGLRPDLVSEATTPNLWRLAQAGVWFDRSHAVYPTLTRANSPAISTGCRPGRSGVPGNTFCLPANGSFARYTTGDAANLRRLSDADGHPIVLVDTLADRVHRAGGTTVVVGAGSPGSALLQHPRAAEAGDPMIVDGLDWMAPFMDALQTRFGRRPKRRLPATDWDAYFTRVITDFVLPELVPTLLVFWHTDPDHTSHQRGFAAPETQQSLRDADANLGAILDTYDRLGLRGTTAVVVTSDHGASSLGRRASPAKDLARLLSDGVAAENGGSTFVYSSDPGVVAAIRQLDYVGPVFTRDGRDQTFPLSVVGLDGPRAPDVVFSFTWSDAQVGGVPGTAVGTHGKLVVDHGTLSPYELRNTLIVQGPDFHDGWQATAPVGNIDIAPTLTRILGLDQGTIFEGRVLTEALRNGPFDEPAWQTHMEAREFSARGREWVQRVWLEQVGSTVYTARGTVEPV